MITGECTGQKLKISVGRICLSLMLFSISLCATLIVFFLHCRRSLTASQRKEHSSLNRNMFSWSSYSIVANLGPPQLKPRSSLKSGWGSCVTSYRRLDNTIRRFEKKQVACVKMLKTKLISIASSIFFFCICIYRNAPLLEIF